MHWTDGHNHLHFVPSDELAAVVAAMAAAGVERAVVNATSEADWAAVAAIAARWPERVIPAFGVHPWHAAETAEGWQQRLRVLLEHHPLAGLGECGLDRCRSSPATAVQRTVLADQLRLARELGRTVTLHCVKAWGMLLDELAACAPTGNLLLHSYGGSLETARRLVPLGAYFSVSQKMLERDGTAVLEVFRGLPRDRLLVESDAPSRPGGGAAAARTPADLPAAGRLLATALGLPPAEVAELTTANARACFGW